jgi:hypothetical protein
MVAAVEPLMRFRKGGTFESAASPDRLRFPVRSLLFRQAQGPEPVEELIAGWDRFQPLVPISVD